MFYGFYTAASGMFTQQRILNAQANNIANINTPGYKMEQVVTTTFEHTLQTRIEAGNTGSIGKGSPIRLTEDVLSDYDPSMLEYTDRPFDLAIGGNGYFNINVDGRRMLTRNGNFDIDDEGYLILRGVGRVMGSRGELRVNGSDFTVSQEGEVISSAGRSLGNLMISMPTEEAEFEKATNGLYAVPEGSEELSLEEVENPVIHQKTIERSNVDMNREMTSIIETQRNFQSCSSALQMIDQLNAKTAQIASL